VAREQSRRRSPATLRRAAEGTRARRQAGFGRPSDPAERVAYELKLGEIRAELRPLDPIKRAAVYQAAEDPLVLDAIEGAPPSLVQSDAGILPVMRPFVEPGRVAARRLERVRALDPSGAAELDELRSLADLYRMLGNGLRSEISPRSRRCVRPRRLWIRVPGSRSSCRTLGPRRGDRRRGANRDENRKGPAEGPDPARWVQRCAAAGEDGRARLHGVQRERR
jgi:hypothetical protein